MAAVASTKEGGQPVAFRRACVELGLVTQLVQLLARANEPSLQPARRSALAALAAIATDDPTSDVDNDHALAVCSAGVVPYVVDALSAPDREVQLSGAGCMAVLAEEPRCTKLLLNEGAVPHLLSLASYGPSHGVRATALAAIEQLSHDPDARETLIHLGGIEVLKGLSTLGGDTPLQTLSRQLLGELQEKQRITIAADASTRTQMAHETRLRYSKIWDQANVHRAYAPIL